MRTVFFTFILFSTFAFGRDHTVFTDLRPSAGSQLIYVSSSQGHDSYEGSKTRPVRTLARAYELVRDKSPDWILLKAGDTWNDQTFAGNWVKSGRNAFEKLVVTSYGSGSRPRIYSGKSHGLNMSGDGRVDHVAFVGLHFKPHLRQPGENPNGLRLLASSRDLLVEDCLFENYGVNLVIQEFGGSVIEDLKLRYNIVLDAWSSTSHANGLFLSGAERVLIEGNYFDHNGWNPSVTGAEPTIFNHNVYIQQDARNVVFRRNILSRASSHGIQMRPGGIIEGNILFENALGVLLGGGTVPVEGGVTGVVRSNAILNGRDIRPGLERGFAIDLTNIRSAKVQSNLILNTADLLYPRSITLESSSSHPSGVSNVDIEDNTIFNWTGALGFRGNAPERIRNIRLRGNRIINLVNDRNLVDDRDRVTPVAVESAFNTFFSRLAEGEEVRYGSEEISLATWFGLIGDSTSQTKRPQFVDETRDLARYDRLTGGTGSRDNLIKRLRARPRGTRDARLDAEQIYEHLRSGFVIRQHLTTKK